MQNKFLPCPFCGGEAKIITIGNNATKRRSAQIKCTKCRANLEVGAIFNNLEWCIDKVSKQWNTRVNPELDRYKNALEEIKKYAILQRPAFDQPDVNYELHYNNLKKIVTQALDKKE